MSVYVEQNGSNVSYNTYNSWILLSPIEQSIKEKIEHVGTPLKEWGININRGILTGLNEAFIISGDKKDELIAADPKSAEIIRPILRGRDIKRYGYNKENLYLLFIPWHFPLHKDSSITGASVDAEILFKQQYPAVYNHLLQYKEKLSSRNKAETGIRYEWYALQRWGAKYWDDFSKQKIVWGNLCLSPQFAYTESEIFINAPATMIVPGNKYILAVLNSPLADWYMRKLGVTRNGGYFEYKPMFIEKLPVPIIKDEDQADFAILVDKISKLLINNQDITLIERYLNNMIFNLYHLTDSEITYIINEIKT